MAKEKNLKRVNVNVTMEVNDFFENESIRTGVSKSGLMLLALEQHIVSKGMAQTISHGVPNMEKFLVEMQKALPTTPTADDFMKEMQKKVNNIR